MKWQILASWRGYRCPWQIAPQTSEYDRYCHGIRNGLKYVICLLNAPAIWCNEMRNNGRFGIRTLRAWTWQILVLRRQDWCLWQTTPQTSEYDIYRPDIRNGLTLICLLNAPAIWCTEMSHNVCFVFIVGLSREVSGIWAGMWACVTRTTLTAHFTILWNFWHLFFH